MLRAASALAVLLGTAAATSLDVNAKEHAVGGAYTVPPGSYTTANITGVSAGITVVAGAGVTITGAAFVGPVEANAAVAITAASLNSLTVVGTVGPNATVAVKSVVFQGAPAIATLAPQSSLYRLRIPVVSGAVSVWNTTAAVTVDAATPAVDHVRALWFGGADGGTITVDGCTTHVVVTADAKRIPMTTVALQVDGAFSTGATVVKMSDVRVQVAGSVAQLPADAAKAAAPAAIHRATAAAIATAHEVRTRGVSPRVAAKVTADVEAAVGAPMSKIHAARRSVSPQSAAPAFVAPAFVAPAVLVAALSYSSGRTHDSHLLTFTSTANTVIATTTAADESGVAAAPFGMLFRQEPGVPGPAAPAVELSATTVSVQRIDGAAVKNHNACGGDSAAPLCGVAVAVLPGRAATAGDGSTVQLRVGDNSRLTATAPRAAVGAVVFGSGASFSGEVAVDRSTLTVAAAGFSADGVAAIRGAAGHHGATVRITNATVKVEVHRDVPQRARWHFGLSGLQLFTPPGIATRTIVVADSVVSVGCLATPNVTMWARNASGVAFAARGKGDYSVGTVAIARSECTVCAANTAALEIGFDGTAVSPFAVSVEDTVLNTTGTGLLGGSFSVTLPPVSSDAAGDGLRIVGGSMVASIAPGFTAGALMLNGFSSTGAPFAVTIRPAAIAITGIMAAAVLDNEAYANVAFDFAPAALTVALSMNQALAYCAGLMLSGAATASTFTATFTDARLGGYGTGSTFFSFSGGDSGTSVTVKFAGTSTIRVADEVEHMGAKAKALDFSSSPDSATYLVTSAVPSAPGTVEVVVPTGCEYTCSASVIAGGTSTLAVKNLHIVASGDSSVFAVDCGKTTCLAENVTASVTAAFAPAAAVAGDQNADVRIVGSSLTARSALSSHGVVLDISGSVKVSQTSITSLVTGTPARHLDSVRATAVFLSNSDNTKVATVVVDGSSMDVAADTGAEGAVVAAVAVQAAARDVTLTVLDSDIKLRAPDGALAAGLGLLSESAASATLQLVGKFDADTAAARASPVRIDVTASRFAQAALPKGSITHVDVWLNAEVTRHGSVASANASLQIIAAVKPADVPACTFQCNVWVVGGDEAAVESGVEATTTGFGASAWAAPVLQATLTAATTAADVYNAVRAHAMPTSLPNYAVAAWSLGNGKVQFALAGHSAPAAVQAMALKPEATLRALFGMEHLTENGAPITPAPATPQPIAPGTPVPPPGAPGPPDSKEVYYIIAGVAIAGVGVVVVVVAFLLYRRRQRAQFMYGQQQGYATTGVVQAQVVGPSSANVYKEV